MGLIQIFLFILIFILILILISLLYDRYLINMDNIDELSINNNIVKLKNNSLAFENQIPKIIHHLAPADQTKWKNEWYSCLKTWFDNFPKSEYKHLFWNDEQLREFMKNNFNWFLPIYDNYKENIMRVDISRYFLLYKYGGIYTDMDMMCYKNFFHLLDQNKPNIVGSPFVKCEKTQNSLLASPKNHPFWIDVFQNSIASRKMCSVIDISGPRLLDKVIDKNDHKINILDKNLFNPMPIPKNKKNLYTAHLYSGSWKNPINFSKSFLCNILLSKNRNLSCSY
ncbi:DXD sugar-binding motif protein [uncultured virus]|nr:DXD sugar-binding motif protein [uncultured virus]